MPKTTPIPASGLSQSLAGKLEEILGPQGVSSSNLDRFSVARDLWPRELIRAKMGRAAVWPDAVLWPKTDAQVQAVFRLAQEEGIPVVPLGSSSGVCGGAMPTSKGWVLDLKRMDAIEELDPRSLLVRVQAGLNGERFERRLAAQGFTLGHFPSSIYCSTVGGWVAARSAGQLSTKYGKMEDMVVALRGVLPNGEAYQTVPSPKSAYGPDFKHLVMGSEGTLGAVTAATLRIHPAPQARLFRAFLAPSIRLGTEAIRKLLQRGARPAAVRLYDELDTLIIGSKGSKREGDSTVKRLAKKVSERFPGLGRAIQATVLSRPKWIKTIEGRLQGCLLIYTFEGDPKLAEVEEAMAIEESLNLGLRDLGPEPAKAWHGHRYAVSFKLSPLISEGFFIDTFEVACPWSDLMPLYEGVRSEFQNEVSVMAHFSHAYHEGCSIYFTFAGRGGTPQKTLDLYDRTWKRALALVHRLNSTQSHHHGVGILKQAGMGREHGALLEGLKGFKKAVDPGWISNPGKLGLGKDAP